MADLITGVSGYAAGTIDTATTLVNGVSPRNAEHINGPAAAIVQIEQILGSGPTLKGSFSDLASRLAVALTNTGIIKLDSFQNLTIDRGLMASNSSTLEVRNHTPIGIIAPWPTGTPPAEWLLCNGSNVSRTTYVKLMEAIYSSTRVSSVVSITIASPGVVTWSGHPFFDQQSIYFTSTGSLPTGLTTGTVYYVKYVNSTTFRLSTTPGGANINTSGTQSGVHTGWYSAYGHGDNSTTFTLPDLRGCVIAMVDGSASRITSASTGGEQADTIGGFSGTQTHTLTISETPLHDHTQLDSSGDVMDNNDAGGAGGEIANWTLTGGTTNVPRRTGATGGDGAHSNVQPTRFMNYIIFAGAF